MYKTGRIFLVVILGLLLTACGNEKSGDKVSVDKAEAAQEAEVSKHNAYIELYNKIPDEIQDAMSSYSKICGEGALSINKKALTHYAGYLFSPSSPGILKEALEASSRAPAMPMDEPVKALVPAAQKLLTALKEASDYYARKNYVDDSFARAEGLHEAIAEAYDDYLPHEIAFAEGVEAREAQRRLTAVADLEKEGAIMNAAMLRVLMAAQDLCDEMDRQGLDNSNYLKETDLKSFRPFYDHLAQTLSDLEKVPKKQAHKESITLEVLKGYIESGYKIKTTAVDMMGNIEKGETQIGSNGTPGGIKSWTRSLVDSYNRMQ